MKSFCADNENKANAWVKYIDVLLTYLLMRVRRVLKSIPILFPLRTLLLSASLLHAGRWLLAIPPAPSITSPPSLREFEKNYGCSRKPGLTYGRAAVRAALLHFIDTSRKRFPAEAGAKLLFRVSRSHALPSLQRAPVLIIFLSRAATKRACLSSTSRETGGGSDWR